MGKIKIPIRIHYDTDRDEIKPMIPRYHPRCSSNKKPLSSPSNAGRTDSPTPAAVGGSNCRLGSVARLVPSGAGSQSVTRVSCRTPARAVFVNAFDLKLWVNYTADLPLSQEENEKSCTKNAGDKRSSCMHLENEI